MANRTITSTPSDKIPAFVPIEHVLYSVFINGLYKDSAQILSESCLTAIYGDKQNMVRLALAILILDEDGFIQKRQGNGKVITDKWSKEPENGKRISNSIIQISKEDIDAIDISYH